MKANETNIAIDRKLHLKLKKFCLQKSTAEKRFSIKMGLTEAINQYLERKGKWYTKIYREWSIMNSPELIIQD